MSLFTGVVAFGAGSVDVFAVAGPEGASDSLGVAGAFIGSTFTIAAASSVTALASATTGSFFAAPAVA